MSDADAPFASEETPLISFPTETDPEDMPGMAPDPAAEESAEQQEQIDETALIDFLIAEGKVEAAALENLVQRQQEQYDRALGEIKGTSFTIHAATQTLYIQDYLSRETLATIDLSSEKSVVFDGSDPPLLPIESWERWGTAICGLNPNSGQIDKFLPVDQDHLYGLVMTEHSCFMYVEDPYRTQLLAESWQCLYHRVHKGPAPASAHDLYLSEDKRHLCIGHRESGKLTVISTETHSVLGQVQIRPPGGTRAINVAFAYYEPKIYITDNQSARLLILHLDDMYLETALAGQPGQIYGNIARAPDIRYLFLLQLKPSVQLQYLDIEAGDFETTIPIKGNGFSNLHIDPCDLMTMTPDQNHLLLMTSHNEPQPFTPCIWTIDPHHLHAVRHQTIPNALKEQTKPVALVFLFQNQIVNHQKTPMQLLLEHGLTDEETLSVMRKQLEERKAATGLDPIVVDLDAPDAPSQGQGQVPALVPQAGEQITLAPDLAIPAILLVLGQKLYQQAEIDLPAHAEEHARFKQLAEGYRQFLEGHDAVEVLVEEILGQHRLETLITRQEILGLMARAQAKGAQELVRPPMYCPSCRQRLMGKWDCPACFLELESPSRIEKKKLTSLDALGAVSRFHLLLTDPRRKRLLVLDDNKTIDWELHAQEFNAQSPWNALWLPNQNLLVVDRDGNQIFECSPTGNLFWSFDQTLSEAHALNGPVKATYYSHEYDESFLIVDQGNHRVLRVDRRMNILWQYGVSGVPGTEAGFLNSPSDVQLTYDGTYLIADTGNDRVLEVKEQEIVREFGQAQGLSGPVHAQRLFDGDTLVVDAGTYRVLELDFGGEIVSECFYFSEEMDQEMRIDRPSRVYRREKKSVVLMDEDKILEIQPLKRRLVWSSLLRHLAKRVEIQRDAFDKRDSYVQSFYQYRMPTLQELIERLRQENRLESSSGIAQRIYENLNALIEHRRERDMQRARQAQAKTINEAPLQPVHLWVIDRTNQQVVRIDREGAPVWHFGTDPAHKLLRPTFVSETPTSLLIADTSHNRVLEVDFESKDVRVIGEGLLSKPRSAWRTELGNTLVTDQGYKRLVEYDTSGGEVWEFRKLREISFPFYAAELGAGTILFVDWALHMVKEINRAGELIWAYGTSSRIGSDENQLSSPEFAVRLPSGATLIADTGNHRLIEVTPKRKILWEFSGNKKYSLHKPNFCQRLANGHTLIAYNSYRELLEIDREGEALWHFELGNEAMVRGGSG